MFNLIIKNIRLQKFAFIINILWVPVLIVTTVNKKNIPYACSIIYLFVITFTIFLSTAYISGKEKDMEYGSDILLNSLPIKRREIVASKVFSVLALFIIYSLIFIFYCFLNYLITKTMLLPAPLVIAITFIITMLYGVISGYISLLYKNNKIAIFRILIFMTFILSFNFIKKINFDKIIINTPTFIINNIEPIFIFSAIIVLFISILSIIPITKLYERKDF